MYSLLIPGSYPGFEMFSFKDRSILWSAQRIRNPKGLNIQENFLKSSAFVEITEKVIAILSKEVLNSFHLFLFCLNLLGLENVINSIFEIPKYLLVQKYEFKIYQPGYH